MVCGQTINCCAMSRVRYPRPNSFRSTHLDFFCHLNGAQDTLCRNLGEKPPHSAKKPLFADADKIDSTAPTFALLKQPIFVV